MKFLDKEGVGVAKVERERKTTPSIVTEYVALAGVAQWIECRPSNQRVASSVSSQGTCLGFRPGPQLGARKRQLHIDISLPLLLLPFPSV